MKNKDEIKAYLDYYLNLKDFLILFGEEIINEHKLML